MFLYIIINFSVFNSFFPSLCDLKNILYPLYFLRNIYLAFSIDASGIRPPRVVRIRRVTMHTINYIKYPRAFRFSA